MKHPLERHLKRGMVLLAAASIAFAGSGCAAKPVGQETQEEKQTPVKVSKITNSSLTVDKEIVGTMKADVNVTKNYQRVSNSSMYLILQRLSETLLNR
ncbi:hypothetical protein P9265_01435 [Schinkia azotoformans]|uniref:hypothetical protein n=1 Tax=Schinkia azotoformans TaxID=1454 RepID=UPI002E21B7D9|nr:hypothetical protein [Schinkia azotoformans]